MRFRARKSAFSSIELAGCVALAALLGALLMTQARGPAASRAAMSRPAVSRAAASPREQRADEPPVRVAAAISLREAVTAIAGDFEARCGVGVEFIFGSSGQLLTQIRGGAPIDVFIAAAHEQVDAVERENLAAPGGRRVVARNELALIAPKEGGIAHSGFEDLARNEIKRLAIGQPETVPAGQYARQVLASLRIEAALGERLVFGANVRQVLDYVARGEVSAGVVYVTDARAAGEAVRVVAVARSAWHEPIEYPAVVMRGSLRGDAAQRFLDHATSRAGQAVLARFGFMPATVNGSNARLPQAAGEPPSPAPTPIGP